MKYAVCNSNREAARCAMLADAAYVGPPRSDTVPIGSVEWTHSYATALGMKLPYVSTYPTSLAPWMQRSVRRTLFAEVQQHEFVKPIRLKAFTGGIKSKLGEHVDPAEQVWACEPVKWLAEWRCYILHGKIVGVSQYGEGEDTELDLDAPLHMIEAFTSAPAGYALDVGLLSSGRVALVEVNDGWALGYYKGCSRDAYLELIATRWKEIVESHKHTNMLDCDKKKTISFRGGNEEACKKT